MKNEAIKRRQWKHSFRHALATLTVNPGRPPMQMSAVARARSAKSDGSRSDFENLLGDWERVGQDIAFAAKKVFAHNNN